MFHFFIFLAWLRGTNNHGLLTGHVEAVDLMNGQYHITFDRPGLISLDSGVDLCY